MKKISIVVAIAAAAALTWIVWFRPGALEEAEPEVATEVPVRVGTIKHAVLHAYVTAYGHVEPEPAGVRPAGSAHVAPAVPGIVVTALHHEGEVVAKGEVLFQLDSRAADVAVDFAEKSLERQKRLMQIDGTSERALQDAEQQLDAARVQLALLQVRSPIAGTLTRVSVNPGDAVDLSTVMATVVDVDRLVVSADVPSAELLALATGQTALVDVDDATAPVAASLSFISPQVDVNTGTALVRAALPAGTHLRPGQFVTVRIVSAEHDCLAVPIESIAKNTAGEDVIALVTGDTATQTPVKTGLRDGGLIEVEADDLRAGMTVVTLGAYALPETTRVRILGE